MNLATDFRATIRACYFGNFIQASVINLTPLLFIPLREQFGLSYHQLSLLIAINFATQVAVDVICSHPVDRWGFRPFVVAAPFLTCGGFLTFALSSWLLPQTWVFYGFLLGTVIFSGAGGLVELTFSPIINAIPTDEKRKGAAMSALHSLYAWGQVSVIILSTLLLNLIGRENWQYIVIFWALPPLYNAWQFYRAPLSPPIPPVQRQGANFLLKQPFFYLITGCIAIGGATEVSIVQWSSAYLERALSLPKVYGDIAGMCSFALMLALGRSLYGIYGGKINLLKVMTLGSLLALVCYLGVAISPLPALTLILCALCGFASCLLWPGSVVLAAQKFPQAGAWMFAMLAFGGDIGAAIGPYLIGVAVDILPDFGFIQEYAVEYAASAEQFSLRGGMLLGALYPALTFAVLLLVRRSLKHKKG